MNMLKPLNVMFTDFSEAKGMQRLTGEVKSQYAKLHHTGISENADRCTTGLLYDGKNNVLFHFPPIVVCKQSTEKFLNKMQEIFKDGFNAFIIGAKANDGESLKAAENILNTLEKENVKFNAIIGKQDSKVLDDILMNNDNILKVKQSRIDAQEPKKILSLNDLEENYLYVERDKD